MAATQHPPGYDQDRGPQILAVLWTFLSFAIIIVSLKIYARFQIMRAEGLDDALILFSAVLVVICTSIFTYSIHQGFGRHAYALELQQAVQATKFNYIATPFQIMAYSFPNISVAIFIDRILAPTKTRQIILYGVTGVQVVSGAISCILLFKTCTPTESLWNPMVKAEHCLPTDALMGYNYFVSAYTAFTDVFLAAAPIISFTRLQMERSSKVAVSILMSMTAVAAICAVVKTTKLYQTQEFNDFTYATADLTITATVEANVIIIAACVPTLRPFVKSVKQTISSSQLYRAQTASTGHSHGQFDSHGKSQSWIKLSHANSNQAFIRSQSSQGSESYGLNTLPNPGSNDILRQTVVTTGTETV